MTIRTRPFGELRPDHQFRAIISDPPWSFKTYTDEVSNRDPRNHYKTMSFAEILALPVSAVAAADAHLFLWTTGPMLNKAFKVIDAWGFRYSGIAFTWVKLKRSCLTLTRESDFHVGMGYTTRKNTEICLLARRGNARRRARDVRELIISPRRQHSRKPDEIYGRVERYCDGPYLELFARASRPGWTTWGNECTKFDQLDKPQPIFEAEMRAQ